MLRLGLVFGVATFYALVVFYSAHGPKAIPGPCTTPAIAGKLLEPPMSRKRHFKRSPGARSGKFYAPPGPGPRVVLDPRRVAVSL
jgi:hypothetical protein